MGTGDSKSRFFEALTLLAETTLGSPRKGVVIEVIAPLFALLSRMLLFT
jgi:hypothetical protein